jgi:hypothetical protein
VLLPRPRIQRTRSGEIRLRLPARERDVLRRLPRQLGLLLETGGEEVARLFPPAYADDPAGNEEYDGLVRGELLEGKRRALRIVAETVDADRLDEEQLAAWVGALNDLRLVLGTRLGVTEDAYFGSPDPDDPRAPELALFAYLTWLQEQGVQALAAAQPGDEADR